MGVDIQWHSELALDRGWFTCGVLVQGKQETKREIEEEVEKEYVRKAESNCCRANGLRI